MWDEIAYPFPKLQRLHRWSLGMDIQFHTIYHCACDYLSMLGLKLIHVSKGGPGLVKMGLCRLKNKCNNQWACIHFAGEDYVVIIIYGISQTREIPNLCDKSRQLSLCFEISWDQAVLSLSVKGHCNIVCHDNKGEMLVSVKWIYIIWC